MARQDDLPITERHVPHAVPHIPARSPHHLRSVDNQSCPMSFEQKSTILVILALLAGPATIRPTLAADAVQLTARRTAGQLTSVDYQIKLGGELKVNAGGKEITRQPIKVDADLEYHERILAIDEKLTPRRSIRHYITADARIDAGGRPSTSTLDAGRRLIVHQLGDQNRTMFSPLGPLLRDQLELIEVPGNSLTLDALLPGKSLNIGDHWTHGEDVVAALLGLEVVTSSDLQSKLVRREGDEVVLEAQGKVEGAMGGVFTQLKIEARYRFHTKHGWVSFFVMDIEEDRSIGHVSPGYDIAARVQVAVTPLAADDPELADDRLSKLTLTSTASMELLDYRSTEGGFQFHHDRKWHIMFDRSDTTVLRMVDQGELVAQCNISSLSDLETGKRRDLEGFQADIKTALADVIGDVVEAEHYQTDAGLDVLRVVVSGKVDELPLRWIYYHVSDDDGRRVAYVVTLEPKLDERLADSDRQFVEQLRFTSRPESVLAAQQGGEEAADSPAKETEDGLEHSPEAGPAAEVEADHQPHPSKEPESDTVASESRPATDVKQQLSQAPEPTAVENKDESSATARRTTNVKLPSHVGAIRGRLRR